MSHEFNNDSWSQITNQTVNKDEMNAQLSLLSWCQANVEGYDSVRVNNFSTCWRDGKALTAILNRHKPDKISFVDTRSRSNIENLKRAFIFAESEFGIMSILDPEDIDTDYPDEKSIMTYVSMLYNAIPNIPFHPDSIKQKTHRKAILEEYSQTSRSLMAWLKKSISTMDNRHVPSDKHEIKRLLDEIKQFRLEEYASRLREKKRLNQLSEDLMLIKDSDSTSIENETKSVEKVWLKFDNYIQLRENLLEKTLKKYEKFQQLINKIEKLYDSCEKRMEIAKKDFEEVSSQLRTMNPTQLRSFNERFNEYFINCENDILKMFTECKHLKEEEHVDADDYHSKINQLQNDCIEIKSNITNGLNSSKAGKKSQLSPSNADNSTLNQLQEYLTWIAQKTKQIQKEPYPEELIEIEKELNKKIQMHNEIQKFRENYFNEFKRSEEKQKDNLKYNLNELEIAYNLLFNETNHRIKCLHQLRDFVESVNTELLTLDQKEEVELTRDWSTPNKLDTDLLQSYKKTLDEELNSQEANKIQPALNKGNALVEEKHPASHIIKIYMEALGNQLEWVKQLSNLLELHSKNLIDVETFHYEMTQANSSIDDSRRKLLDVLSNSTPKNYAENITKTEEVKQDLKANLNNIESLRKKSTTLTAFGLRKKKLKTPNDKCRCLMNFTNADTDFEIDEVCVVEENSQRIKWKVMTEDEEVVSVPSVCFNLVAVDEDAVSAAEQLKKRCEDLYRETSGCQRQFKKDRLLNLMNIIKFCEIDEYDERHSSEDKDQNLHLLLANIKSGVDELLSEPSMLTFGRGNPAIRQNDLKLIVESYERCCTRLDELSKKSKIRYERTSFENEINNQLNALEKEFLYLQQKLNELKSLNGALNLQDNVDNIIGDLKEFQNNDLKTFDDEIRNSYQKLDSYKQHNQMTPTTRNKDNMTRQKIDGYKQQASAMRKDSENYSQNLNLVKTLISLLENANSWITKFEARLTCKESVLVVNELTQLLPAVQRLFAELNDIHTLLKDKQGEFEHIRDLYDRIVTNKVVFGKEVSNLDEILDAAEEIKQRNIDMFAQISERNADLHEIMDAYDQYRRNYQTESKWIIMLKNQIVDYQRQQEIYKQQKAQVKRKYQTHDNADPEHEEINNLKSQFNPIAQTFSELGSKSTQIDDLNQAGVELIKILQRYNRLLSEYRNQTDIESITSNTTPSRPNFAIISQVRQELNNFNREYAGLLDDHNKKIIKLTNTISQSDKHFSVHIKFKNAEPLIEKFNKDIFERYELINEVDTNNNHSRAVNRNSHTTNKNQLSYSTDSNPQVQFKTPEHSSNIKNSYYYYDTVNKDLVNLDSIDNSELTLNKNTIYLNNGNGSMMIDTAPTKLVYPLSFIDAVNKKQLDMENGLFRDPQNGSINLRLNEAIMKKLLDPKTAYFHDSAHNQTYNLEEAFHNGIVTNTARGIIIQTMSSSSNQTMSIIDALKTGYLKIGQPLLTNGSFLNSSTRSINSVTSETQSMSVRSIRDPLTGEFLMPTEAIKRKLLDPYKGLFIHPKTGESLPISEAIQKGYVIVEILVESPSTVKKTVTDNTQRTDSTSSNIISTSLIRETKSYHLLGVFDPAKNDEITVKEAIAKGILDRQKGLYIHPVTRESFSISDAINKGVIRARILPSNSSELSLTENTPQQCLLSSNRFEENRTYTICGAIDMRTGQKLSLSQAIKEGVIDSKSGTYVNLKTGETLSINKAIDAQLVLTEIGQPKQRSPVQQIPPPRDIRILNIEFVQDPRTQRNITISDAMTSGLLDRKCLSYRNPITNETLSLNKAYNSGYILGHYTDSTLNELSTQSMSSASSSHFHSQQYFIISVFNPITNKSMSLDQAVHQGLFDHLRSVYIHPDTREVVSLNDAVRRGLVDAQIFDDVSDGKDESHRYDSRLPVAAFGIDKKVTNMRTKFNKDGTSIIQIEIESLKPTRGVYELDEIEDFNYGHGSIKEINISSKASSQEIRQVVDINSVHRIKDESSSHYHELVEPINNVKTEKTVLVNQVSKEFGGSLDSQRIEHVIDDDRIARIDVKPKFKNNYVIPERKAERKVVETVERKETLIIDDGASKRMNMPYNIDGQTHVSNRVFQIGSEQFNKTDYESTQKSVEELTRRYHEIDSQKVVKVPKEEIVDRQKETNRFLDIAEDKREVSGGKLIIDIFSDTPARPPVPVETIIDDFPKVETSIVEEIIYEPMVEEEDEEMFDEWTEVFTITIRSVRYKIIWVYDSLKNERVTLREAIRRGIINTEKSLYHNLKMSTSQTITEAVDDGLIGVEEDTSALTVKVNGITYTVYWVWDPVKKKRIAPRKAVERGVLDLNELIYRNYLNEERTNIHEAVYLGLIGASDDLTNIDEELILEIDSVTYKIAWVKDSISKEKLKPRIALKRGLLNLASNLYNKYDTKEILTIRQAIQQHYIGISNEHCDEYSQDDESEDESYTLDRQDSLVSLDDEELTIKTKKAIYVITGLLHPETQKEIKVSEAIESGILDKENGSYKDFKTNVVYEVGEAINEGFVFATVTDLLADETASTEFIREEIKRFIIKSVVDPRSKERIGGLQAQAAGILNYAQGMYSNPATGENISISEAIMNNLIEVTLQEETSKEEFDAEVITETLMERIVTNYRIVGVLDPFSNEMISGYEAVHRQIIDTETNAYVDSSQTETVPIKEAVRRNLIKAEVSERCERKTLGLSLQNAIRLGLFSPESGKFRDPYTNNYFDLNQAIEKGHINPNGNAVADSSSGSMTLNEAFSCGIFNKKSGMLDRSRLSMFKARIVEAKIYKWNFEDAVKCGLVNLKTGKYKHQQSGEILTIKDAINRGLIDGESTIIENPLTNNLLTLKQTLDTVKIDDKGQVIDPMTNDVVINLEAAFNHRKIFSAFNENTGEIFLTSRGKIVPFEKAMRKNKMDKSVRIFDPKSNKDLTINDAIERAIIDKTSGMIIDPKGGGLLSIKEAVKRGILCLTGAPVVTGHHENNETIETATITSKKSRHLNIQFDEVNDNGDRNFVKSYDTQKVRNRSTSRNHTSSDSRTKKTPIVYDTEYLNSDYVRENPGVINDMNTKTTIKTTTEEHRKRISGQDVTEKIKADFKETVLSPGERPHVQSTALYEKEFKSKLPTGSDDTKSTGDAFLNLTTAAFNRNTNDFNNDIENSAGRKIEIKTHLNGFSGRDMNKKVHNYIDDMITDIMQITKDGFNVDYIRYLEKEKAKYTPQNEC